MGEAKRRQATDPAYGKIPKKGRGLVVSAPVSIDGETVFAKSSSLDPQELRMALLFWDRLVWPSSNIIHFGSGPDESFLEQVGVLSRPSYRFSGSGAASLVAAQALAFSDLDAREPGIWSLAQGENSLLAKNGLLKEGRGAYVELVRAIPVPDREVPLAEVLDLKRKRADELLALRCELDDFYSSIQRSSDQDFELTRHMARIDMACRDLLLSTKCWAFPTRLTNLKASIEVTGQTLFGVAAGFNVGQEFGLPLVGTVLGATLGSLKVSADITVGKTARRTSPYRYVYSFHRELFGLG